MAALLVVLALAAAGALLAAQWRPELAASLLAAWLAPPGGAASLEKLDIRLWPPTLELRGLSAGGPPASGQRLELAALTLRLDPAGWLGGRPWLERVRVRGLHLTAAADAGPGQGATGPPDLAPLAWLLGMGELELAGGRATVTLAGGALELEHLAVGITPGEGGRRVFQLSGRARWRQGERAVVSGAVGISGLVEPGPRLNAHLSLPSVALNADQAVGSAEVAADLELTRRRLEVHGLTVHGAGLALAPGAGAAAWRPASLELAAEGGLGLAGEAPAFRVRRLAVGELLKAGGAAAGGDWASLRGALEGELNLSADAWRRLTPLLPSATEGLAVSGLATWRLVLSPGPAAPRLGLTVQAGDLSLDWPAQGLSGALSARLAAEDLAGRGALSGRASLAAVWRAGDWAASGAGLSASLTGDLAAPRLGDLRLDLPEGGLAWRGRPLPLGRLTVLGGLSLDQGGAPCLSVGRVEAGRLGTLTGELTCAAGGPSGRLGGGRLAAGDLVSLIGALAGADTADWGSQGSLGLTVGAAQSVDGGGRLTCALASEGLGLASPDGRFMAQGLDGSLKLETALGAAPRLALDLKLPRGELLLDTVYLRLADHPLSLGAAAAPASGGLRDLKARLEAGGLLRLEVAGEAAPGPGGWAGRLKLSLGAARLGPLFSLLVAQPLAATRPELNGLAASGAAELSLTVSGRPDDLALDGSLRVRSGGLGREGDPPVLEGLELDLPLAYSLGGRPPQTPGPPERWGALALERLRPAEGVEMGPLKLGAALSPNRLRLKGAVSLPLFGGSLRLADMVVDEPLSPDFAARLSARLEGLDLSRLPTGGLALEGSLAGDLGRVRLDRGSLRVPGELSGKFFGGRLTVRGLGARLPLSPGRELAADLAAEGVHLDRLSKALDVGQVHGRMNISCRGLRVAYGQPVAFDLRVMSEPAEGVEQTVSLKAVNSISVVGTGASLSGTGISLMKTFFDQFPYEKIGFACTLKNDVFTIRGLVVEDGVQYLVRRPLFRGINVINRNTENRISFKGMLERLARLGEEGAAPEIR